MSSIVQICNLALQRLGQASIQSITELSTEAKNCNAVYDHVRKTVLRSHNWNFATKEISLAPLVIADEDLPTGFAVGYQIPSDCIKIIEIAGGTKANPIPFIVRGKVLYTNVDEARLVYVRDEEDPTIYDDQFIMAFSYRLGADIALALTGDPSKQSMMYQLYAMELSDARRSDADESKPTQAVTTFLSSRS